MLWLLDCLPEVESDLSAFHRVDDMGAMESRRFFRLARLLPAYEGAVRDWLRRQAADRPPPAEQAVDLTPEMLAAHPDLDGLVELG